MRARWTDEAIDDLDGQMAYWTGINARVAQRYRRAIKQDVAFLRRYPFSGRRGVGITRESVVSRTPFVITYRIDPSEVVILRIWHGAQDRPLRDDGRVLGQDDE